MKKLLPLSLMFLTLVGCNPKPAVDTKIEIVRSENPSLITITPFEVEEKTITNGENYILTFIIQDCPYCLKAQNELETYAKKHSIDIFLCDVTRVNTSGGELDALINATSYEGEDYFVFPLDIGFPQLYIFTKRYVAIAVNENFTSTLDRLISVIPSD